MSELHNQLALVEFDVPVVNDEDDEVDEMKRKSRNLSEKRRRDQFNSLITELKVIVSSNNQRMDKSMVLKTAINKMKIYNENAARSKEFEISEDYKPKFLTNEEYSFLMLQSLSGFIIVFSSCGKILYTSSGLALLLGYLLEEMLNMSIYDIVSEHDRLYLERMFFISSNLYPEDRDNTLHFDCRLIKKAKTGDSFYEPVEFVGCIKTQEIQSGLPTHQENGQEFINKQLMFAGLVRLQIPQIYTEILLNDHLKIEFVSHHNFEWKFLFLDDRASSIIGYSPFEIVGTSGYDYYHVDDLENVVAHHKMLMVQDEGTSGYYRFLTKGHQWIWLQTKSYMNRKQWNSTVEIVCTHRVVNPLIQKNEPEIDSKLPDWNPASNSSSVDTGSSNKTSPPSWLSTSESNYCEEDQMSGNYEDYFQDDNCMSSSTSAQEVYLHKKRKTHRKFHRSQRFMDNLSNNSDSSNNNYSCSLVWDYSAPRTIDISEYQNTAAIPDVENLENSLQKKYTELQKIIADRTEELRVVSQQLIIARSANHPTSDIDNMETIFTTEPSTNEDINVFHQFNDVYCNPDCNIDEG